MGRCSPGVRGDAVVIDSLRLLIDAIVGTGTTGERGARWAFYALVSSTVLAWKLEWSAEGWTLVIGVPAALYYARRTIDGATGATGGKAKGGDA